MSDLPGTLASTVTEEVAGQTLEMAPLDLKDLGSLERQALKFYKDNSVQSFVEMAGKYLPEADRGKAIRETIDKIAFMDIDSLPEKEQEVAESDGKGGVRMKVQKIPWAAWWMQRTFDGMLHFVWLSAKKKRPNLTFDDCAKLITIGGGQPKLGELVKTVDEISQPAILGN